MRSSRRGARRNQPAPAPPRSHRGHRGYHDCFDAFVADAYQAVRGATLDGLPGLNDGVRAVAITDAVLESARSASRLTVPD